MINVSTPELSETSLSIDDFQFPVFIHAVDEYERLMGTMNEFMTDACCML